MTTSASCRVAPNQPSTEPLVPCLAGLNSLGLGELVSGISLFRRLGRFGLASGAVIEVLVGS